MKNTEFFIVTADGTNTYRRPLEFIRVCRICLAYRVVWWSVDINYVLYLDINILCWRSRGSVSETQAFFCWLDTLDSCYKF